MHQILTIIESVQLELLIFSAVWFLIGALDDALVDWIWIIGAMVRRTGDRRVPGRWKIGALSAPNLPGLHAVFIPTWQEATVIGSMLRRCKMAWASGETEYRIYVGCYPNDDAGARQIIEAARSDAHVRLIICEHPGPTTKADCLNRLWQALLVDELREGKKAKAIILHDAEDYVHADELRIYDRLIEKYQAVQLPVIPMIIPGSKWVSGHYLDEFAAAHGKSLIVRSALGAALPFAGVGVAIDRNILGRVALAHDYKPFDHSSLTEDYELGLKIGAMGGKTIFARLYDDDGLLIGTRAHFPDKLGAAIRQKSRWLLGIALAGWDRIGWNGNLSNLWMLMRDRFTIAIIHMAAYLAVILALILLVAVYSEIYQMRAVPSDIVQLLFINLGFLVWHMAIRALLVAKMHGPAQAALSIPRAIVANIIMTAAAFRAVFIYAKYCLGGRLIWEKTNHEAFPDTPYD